MDFWKMAWDYKSIDIEMLRKAVITKDNEFGDITKEEFKEISGQDFDNKEEKQ